MGLRIERLENAGVGPAHSVVGHSSRGCFAISTKVPVSLVKLQIDDAQVIMSQIEAIEVANAILDCVVDG